MYGFEVDIATNSVNMLRSLQKSLPDCIILDYEMPDINGPQLCKTLKTLTKNIMATDDSLLKQMSKEDLQFLFN